jgi:hypothetical protein
MLLRFHFSFTPVLQAGDFSLTAKGKRFKRFSGR